MSDYITKTQGKTKWTISDYKNWIDAGTPLNETVKQLLLFKSGLTDEQLVDKFDNLPNVDYIKLYGNDITYIPPSIGKLQKLRSLYLSETKITTLPDELKNNHNELRITVNNTPLLENPPPQLLTWTSNIKFEPSLQINEANTSNISNTTMNVIQPNNNIFNSNATDNAVIQITTHGNVMLTHSLMDPSEFVVPDNMTLIYISVAAPGVCNLLTSETSYEYRRTIMENLNDINNKLNLITDDTDLKELETYFKDFSRPFRNRDTVMEYNPLIKEKNRNPFDTEFVYTFDRTYNVTIYKSGDIIRNKIYSRRDKETLFKPSYFDYKINMFSNSDTSDLMIDLSGKIPNANTPSSMSQTTLQHLLFFLKKQGIKNVVIFDFSCSVFDIDGKDVEKPREIRSIRRDIIKEKEELTKKRNRNRNTIGESSSKTQRNITDNDADSDTGFKGGRSRKRKRRRRSRKRRRRIKGTKRIRK
jgi:hypothetical protein